MISILQLLTLTVWARFSVLADCWGPEGYFVCLFIKTWVQMPVRMKHWRMLILITEMQDCSGKKCDAEPQNLTEELSASGMCFSLLLWVTAQIWAKQQASENLSANMFCKHLWEPVSSSPWMLCHSQLQCARGSLRLMHIQIQWVCFILGHKNPSNTWSSVSQCWHWVLNLFSWHG